MTASPNLPPIGDDPDDPPLDATGPIVDGLEYIKKRYGDSAIPPGSEPSNYMAGGEVGIGSCVDPTRRASLYRVDQPAGAPIPASVANSPGVRRAGEVVGFAFVMLVLVALTVFLAEILVKTGIWIWDM